MANPIVTELDFIGKRRKHTDRFAEEIVKQVLHSDPHNVALNNNLTDEEVWSMVKYISKKKLKIDLSELKRLGIDEIAMRKGQDNFIVVLVDLERNKPIGFVESRKQEDMKKVLAKWGSEVLNQIIEVSIDLSGNYKGLVEKVLPNADIVADRFHVMKLINQELNAARNQAIKLNDNNQDLLEKERVSAALNQSKYAILKPEDNLTEKQKVKLEEVRAISPLLARMHQQKEAFRAIFETAENWADGTFRLLDWLDEAQKDFQKSVGTICRWFGEVTGYFEQRTTSGVVEGINNKLKLIKRSGYGFRNFNNFQLRCLICWNLDTSSA